MGKIIFQYFYVYAFYPFLLLLIYSKRRDSLRKFMVLWFFLRYFMVKGKNELDKYEAAEKEYYF